MQHRLLGRAHRIRLAWWWLVTALTILVLPAPALAQDASGAAGAPGASGVSGVHTNSAAQVEFGSEIRFQLQATSEQPISSVLFLYQVDDSPVQNTGVPTYQPGTSVVANYIWRVATVLVPGTEIRYQWELVTADGRRQTTQEQTVVYNDTRFAWREVRGDQVTVYMPQGDASAGQALLDEAARMQERLRRDYGLTLDKPLRIYAYTRAEDYTSALYTGQPLEASMTVGADRIFVLARGGTSGLTPVLQGLRREMATAMFHQKTGNAYAPPPQWLAFGFSIVISGEELPPDTMQALKQLADANRLLPLRTLGGNFPNNERDYNLAQVESVAAVQYIASAYGAEKLRALLAAFKEGNTADDALKKSLGVSLEQFETRWKNALKSGTISRPAPAQPGVAGAQPGGDGGLVDRMFGPALRYWQGVFGQYTQPVLFGAVGLVTLGVVALVVGTGVSLWRKGRAEDY